MRRRRPRFLLYYNLLVMTRILSSAPYRLVHFVRFSASRLTNRLMRAAGFVLIDALADRDPMVRWTAAQSLVADAFVDDRSLAIPALLCPRKIAMMTFAFPL